ncbi:hypothetical protein MUK42_05959 [Musa troglodytarum]|uniref:Uncharacterized protein n=1 Tax=Musa troglodytarum TaxID=320322 RepID=A0A9E7H359_9LILI|nr:hypothetical protein MUK42_05959 [Musa troglodytarum]
MLWPRDAARRGRWHSRCAPASGGRSKAGISSTSVTPCSA